MICDFPVAEDRVTAALIEVGGDTVSRVTRDLEARSERTPVLRKAIAGLVVLAVAALVIHVAIHLVLAVFWVFVGLVAVVGVLWALNIRLNTLP